ncbi:MAG: transcription termination/antitermination protein NusG [Acidobacteria bacterium]|nr:transcription termination/antitermination protein NusG [Acidobacteriota bacterium]
MGDKKWYIIHTYSGFERRVAETLMNRIQVAGREEVVGQILIPTEDLVEMKSGKKVVTSRIVYPGYVLVEIEMSDEIWHLIRSIPRVTGFISSGGKPTALTEDEVNQLMNTIVVSSEKPRPKFKFDKGETVKITDGPFANFVGVVDDVNEEKNTLKVSVTIFGRQTPVELDFLQVEKI